MLTLKCSAGSNRMLVILFILISPVIFLLYAAYLMLKGVVILLVAIYESIIFRH